MKVLEVAVVGAGIAGLYAAWRLHEAGVSPGQIAVFESSRRAGGRILTVSPPNEQSLKVDLGAHTLPDTHLRAQALLERMGLVSLPYAVDEPGNLFHLRGRTASLAELKRTLLRAPFPYALSARIQKKGPGRFLRKARERIAGQLDKDGRFRGRPLADWPLDAILREVMAPDELAYLKARSGYSFWESPFNAAALMEWAANNIFIPRSRLGILSDGMSMLTDKFTSALAMAGVPVELSHGLEGIGLPSVPTAPIELHFSTARGPRRISARKVVLALPRRCIEQIEPLGTHPAIRALLDAVEPWPITTTALVYAEPWWLPLGFRGGRTVTDGPAGLMRYQMNGLSPSASAGPAAITFYADGKNASRWRNASASGWLAADHPMTQAMHSEVRAVHEPRLGRPVPEPSCSFVQEWSSEPVGGAFHLWAMGCDPGRAMSAALQPIDGVGLHICGEAWSSHQGWIEGALETTDAVLARHFGIRPLS